MQNSSSSNPVINKVMSIVCVVLIALGLNDAIFNGQYLAGTVNVVAGIVLMPNIMEWNYAKANKYQRVILIAIAILNIGLIIYLVSRLVLN